MRRFLRPDQHESRNLRQNLPRQVAQPRHFGDVRRRVRRGHCRAKRADPRHILGSGAEIALLPAAVDERGQRQTGLDVERTDALRPVDFMSRDRNKVGPSVFALNGTFRKPCTASVWNSASGASRRVARTMSAIGMTAPDSLLTIMMDTKIVSGRSAAFNASTETKPVSSGCKYVTSKPLCLQLLHRMQHGVVLHGGRHDVAPALAEALCRGKNGPVVGPVPPEVKNTRSVSAPSACATCARAVFSRCAASMPGR